MARRDALIEARKERGLKQHELAKMVGISRAYLANIENGNNKPSLTVALRIAQTLEKDVEEVFHDCCVRKTHTA